MSYRADPVALNLVKDFCVDSAKESMRQNVSEDPTSCVFLEHLLPLKVTEGPGVYAIFDEHGNLIKIGSATNLKERESQYDKKYRFRVIFYLDAITPVFNSFMITKYNAMMKVLTQHERLHPFQHAIYKAIVESGGDKLGVMKNIFLQMIELGFKYHCNDPSKSVEFIMFQVAKLKAMYEYINEETNKAVKCLSFLPIEAYDPSVRYIHCKLSWNTGRNPERHSSKRMTTNAVLGERNANNWSDTIPEPAVPNGKNAAEIFCQNFPSKTRAEGRDSLRDTIQELLASQTGTVYVDENKCIFQDDPLLKTHKSVHDFLIDEFHCEFVPCDSDRNIWYYKCRTGVHSIVVHKALCRASDSRDITMEDRFDRGIDVAVLCNMERDFNGDPRLSVNDVLGNPVHAMYYFQYTMYGFHLSPRQAAAFYREGVKLDDSDFPLIDNALGKTPDEAVPVGLRTYDRSNSRPPPIRLGTDDHRIINTARALFNNHECIKDHPEEEDAALDLPTVFDQLVEILLTNKGSDGDNLKKRFDSFVLELCLDSFYIRQLTSIWSDHLTNPGNTSTGPGKAISQVQILENNEALVEFFEHHGPTEEHPVSACIWVKTGNYYREFQQIGYAENGVLGWGLEDCPGEHLMIANFTSEGLKTRFREKNLKEETFQARAIQFEEFGIVKQSRIGYYDDKTWTLVRVTLTGGGGNTRNNGMSNKAHTKAEIESNQKSIDKLIEKCRPAENKNAHRNLFWVKMNPKIDVIEDKIKNARNKKRGWAVEKHFPGNYPVLPCYHSITIFDLFKKKTVASIKDPERKNLRSGFGVQNHKRVGYDDDDQPWALMYFLKD